MPSYYKATKLNILCCLSQKIYAQLYLSLRVYLPLNSVIQVFGFYWSTGIILKNSDCNYNSIPFSQWKNVYKSRLLNKMKDNNPSFYFFNPNNFSVQLDELIEEFIKNQILKFKPDIIIIDNLDSIEGKITLKIAKEVGIPTVTLHTSFMKDRLIVSDGREDWATLNSELSNEDISSNKFNLSIRNGDPFTISSNFNSWHIQIERMERLMRQLPLFIRNESRISFFRSVKQKINKPTWFPKVDTLKDIRLIGNSFILIVLNSSDFGSKGLKRCDLIALALQSCPENSIVVIRPHPLEVPTVEDHDEFESNRPNCKVWISRPNQGPNLDSLINNCKALITLSSAAGFEALLKGKPVFTLAPTFYTHGGCADYIKLDGLINLKKVLSSPKLQLPNPEIVWKLARIINDKHSFSFSNGACRLAQIIQERHLGE
jgi:hypothetical protein